MKRSIRRIVELSLDLYVYEYSGRFYIVNSEVGKLQLQNKRNFLLVLKTVISMTKYREIIRLARLNLSQINITRPLEANKTHSVIEQQLFPRENSQQAHSSKHMPDYAHICESCFLT